MSVKDVVRFTAIIHANNPRRSNLKKVLDEEDIRLLAELEVQKDIKRKHIIENRLNYFGNYDPELDKDYPDLKLKGPNPVQQKLLDAWMVELYKIFTFTGSNRLGKTFILKVIALSVMFGEWLWSGEKIPFIHKRPRKVRIVGQDWEKHIKAVTIPALEMLWPKERPLYTKKNNQGVEALWTDKITGSTLEIMSNSQESRLHEGWEGDLVGYDEPPKRDIRVANARGLVDREGRELFTMTLISEAWVHREVIKALDKDGFPEKTGFHINGDIKENVGFGLTQKGVDQFTKTLKPEEIEARIHGKPAYLSGLIFPKFDRHIHIKNRFEKGIPLDWPVDIAIDWHPSKGWAIQMVATDSLQRKWVIWEIFVKANYKWIAEELVRVIRKDDLRIDDPFLIDPLAKSGSQSDINEETVYDKLENELIKYGYYLETASKDQNSGIEIINEYLMTESEEPALFVFRECPITIQHMEDWMWVDGKPAADGEDMCENLYRIMLRNTRYMIPNLQKSSSKPSNWKVV